MTKLYPLANLGEVSMAGAHQQGCSTIARSANVDCDPPSCHLDPSGRKLHEGSAVRDRQQRKPSFARLCREVFGQTDRSDSSSKRVFKRVMTEKDKSKRHGLKRKRKFAESAAWKASSGGGRQKVCKTRNTNVRRKTSCR